MNDETYGQMMEARALTRHVAERCGIRAVTRSLPELGELSVSLPYDISPDDLQNVADELEADGYAITCLGFNGEREIRVAALGW